MRIKRFMAAPLVAALLATGFLLSAPAPMVLASGVETCLDNPSNGTLNQKTIVSRALYSAIGTLDPFAYQGAYTAVYAEAYVRVLQPCTGGYANGIAIVMPNTIERLSSSGGWHVTGMVQLGYWQASDGHRSFAYTTSDNDANPCHAYGCMTEVGPTPIVGHRYAFFTQATGGTWVYAITDLNTGQIVWTTATLGHWTTGHRVWYGYEGLTANDQLGVDNAPRSLQVVLTNMKRQHTNGAWSRVDGLYSCQKITLSGHVPVYCAFPSVQTTRDTLNVYS